MELEILNNLSDLNIENQVISTLINFHSEIIVTIPPFFNENCFY